MAIFATTLPPPGINLFSSLPSSSNDPNKSQYSSKSSLPIPIPKYPPIKSRKHPPTNPPNDNNNNNPAFKIPHRRTNYYKLVRDSGVISTDGDRSVIVGDSGVSYLVPGAPFEFQFSYSETPKVKPVAIREPAFLPFAPPSMPRPWTGKAPLKKSKPKKIPLFDSTSETSGNAGGVRRVEMARPVSLVKINETRTRKEILGEPLRKVEIRALVQPYISNNRQVNLGRDGLTHNMLELVHSHWRRQPICKVRCKGVPTIDMNNICHHLEEKTGGKIIHRVGGIAYLFRGRNYNYTTRPQYPVMLWKPAAPVYPKLIQEAPEGLTKIEADEMRMKGKRLLPICKLAKNGVYTTLVKDVRNAFEGSSLVKIDCGGMHATDYKKLGAKLKELVPCVLLSFDNEQVLMWRGNDWKSIYRDAPSSRIPVDGSIAKVSGNDGCHNKNVPTICSSPKMMSLWERAIKSSKALLLDNINLDPNALLNTVEEFEGISQAIVHSYPAVVVSGALTSNSRNQFDSGDGSESEDDIYSDADKSEYYFSDEYEDIESWVPLGSLPVDQIAEQLSGERESTEGRRRRIR